MRIDLDYMQDLLAVFQDSARPHVTLDDFPGLDLTPGSNEDLDPFVFHMEILADQDFVETTDDSGGIGVSRDMGGEYVVAVIPLRLTAGGHDFAAALSKAGVIEVLKDQFKNEGPAAVVKGAFALAGKILEKKIGDLVGE